jgi:hypothetical protein
VEDGVEGRSMRLTLDSPRTRAPSLNVELENEQSRPCQSKCSKLERKESLCRSL